MKIITVIIAVLFLGGCSGYELKNLAKSDIDMVADEFIDETRVLVSELTVKLYGRNPDQLRKTQGLSVEDRLQQLRSQSGPLDFAELGGRQEVAALELVFDPEFRGDRVFALVVGLSGMLRYAYGYNDELFMFDQLDSARLLASAENVDVLLWRLKHSRKANGRPFLITSEYRGITDNLSFERLFGKLIVLQEMMARIVDDSGHRGVNRAVKAVGSVFVPLPL
ncbi:hypothetical protein EYC98_17495 [Halieaceae bacterium IMCC14734]|uniref:Lipoprotein n=1 Tax=Candidatus Litorirhabdus singularis TaxID=2518993 RepID=A0ABT3TK43_9GAMM|nr:hypothetical protein [Candidatus Litorirhabdus singularis]MCX2982659.1 hypothetical protein [Candidatus Litorirhabdus singularis]